MEPDPPLDPEPELEPLDPDAEPDPDPDPLLESLSCLWCLWCLWCMGFVVGDGLLAGSLCVADAVGAGLLALGAWAATDAPPQAVTRPRTPAASMKRSLLVRICCLPVVPTAALVVTDRPIMRFTVSRDAPAIGVSHQEPMS